MQYVRAGFWFAIGVMLAVILGIIGAGTCNAAADVTIPRAAQQYRATLVRQPRHLGPGRTGGPSLRRRSTPKAGGATIPYRMRGAQGLAQVMPATARWLPSVAPETGKPAPFNPGWSLRALCVYDKWLWDRVAGHDDFERMAFTLSAYNGGLGWVNRDRKKARALGLDDRVWFDSVENVNSGRGRRPLPKTASIHAAS